MSADRKLVLILAGLGAALAGCVGPEPEPVRRATVVAPAPVRGDLEAAPMPDRHQTAPAPNAVIKYDAPKGR